jgi:hydroxycarboxylate dehydrogenase B
MADIVVRAAPLKAAVEALIAATGSAPEEAAIVADHLVEANLKGHDSHGIGMLPAYVKHVGDKTLIPNRHVRLVKDDGPFLIGDGQLGHGQVVAQEITDLAIERARRLGFAVAGLHMAHHVGRVGTYGERCAAAGLISLHFVNVAGHGPIVAPFRGADARFGTNPLCLTLPATERTPAIVLDFATSRMAMGKVRVANNKKQRLPEGTILDARGRPSVDPADMFAEPRGALRTFGEHKGYGLAMFAELLGGALSGGTTISPHHPRVYGIVNNMLGIVVDPARLGTLPYLKAEIDAFVDYCKASPPERPGEPVLIPGEPERLARAKRLAEGIPVDETSWRDVVAAADTACLGARRFTMLAGVG